MEQRQLMIDKCLVKMKRQACHEGWDEVRLLEKATKWADRKIAENKQKERQKAMTVEFTTTYELIITPSMMAAGEIGVARTNPDGTHQVTYTSFDYTNMSFEAPITPVVKQPNKKHSLHDLLNI